MNWKDKPGSEAALVAGCTCPVINNHYGEGIPYGGPPDPNLYTAGNCWYISGDCPLHAEEEEV